jgi:SNF2 family DNA or RNA helicase
MTMLLDSIEEVLEWAGLDYLRLDGNTKGTERGELLQEFCNSKVLIPAYACSCTCKLS